MSETNEIVIRVATDQDQLTAVHRLRYETYLRKGYILPHPSRMMIDEWDGLPETTLDYLFHKILWSNRLCV